MLLDTTRGSVAAGLEELERTGQLRRDSGAQVVGSAGLSVTPGRHELWIEGRPFWTWCAYDAVGILGALHASGIVRSRDPHRGEALSLGFERGIPRNPAFVIFMADQSCCTSAHDDWCPLVNLFATRESAEAWAHGAGVDGSVVSVGTLMPAAATTWTSLAKEGYA